MAKLYYSIPFTYGLYYYSNDIITYFLNKLNPEIAHNIAISALKNNIIIKNNNYDSDRLKIDLFNKNFKNPVGLAAGFDKNAEAYPTLFKYNFSFIEVGTVTLYERFGNKKPRIFRNNKTNTIINSCGLNNNGVVKIKNNIIHNNKYIDNSNILGISISSITNKNDYHKCITQVNNLSDYIVINISCPNVKKSKDDLDLLLKECKEIAKQPLLIKISPDLNNEQMEYIANVSIKNKIDGIIVSNTTKTDMGGKSGTPLKKLSDNKLKEMYILTNGKIPLIGCGGIMNGKDAYDKIKNGASLIQIYSGFIFEGPEVIYKINKELDYLLEKDNYTNIKEAIGSNIK